MYASYGLTIGRMIDNELFSGTNRFSRRWLLGVLVARDAWDQLSPLSSFPKLTFVEGLPYDVLRDLLW